LSSSLSSQFFGIYHEIDHVVLLFILLT